MQSLCFCAYIRWIKLDPEFHFRLNCLYKHKINVCISAAENVTCYNIVSRKDDNIWHEVDPLTFELFLEWFLQL